MSESDKLLKEAVWLSIALPLNRCHSIDHYDCDMDPVCEPDCPACEFIAWKKKAKEYIKRLSNSSSAEEA